MLIDARRNQGRPPSGGPCQSVNARSALNKHGPPSRRAGGSRHGFYKHGPPRGGLSPIEIGYFGVYEVEGFFLWRGAL